MTRMAAWPAWPGASSGDVPVQKKMKVPFGTIQVPEKSKQLIMEALDGRRLSQGLLVRKFEDRFGELLGVKEAVAVSSGADADALALAALYDRGARRGDEVIVPALSFVATGNAVLQAGFVPRFVDAERATLNIAPDLIEAAITSRTRAIMPVHLMGKPADMDAIMSIAAKHGLHVVEDAAEAHGGFYRGRALGTIGHLGAFSLYVAHIITTVEGGIIATNDESLGDVLRSLRVHGRACSCKTCVLSVNQTYCPKRFDDGQGEDVRFRFDRVGFSCKMNELEAALGLGNLDNYHDIVDKRRRNLLHVISRFDRFAPHLASIKEEPHEVIGPHAIPIVVQEGAPFTRRELTDHLEKNGVETRTLFASMPTQCPGFAFLGQEPGTFPNAEYIGLHGLHVGAHHDLDLPEMDYLMDVLEDFLRCHV